MKVILYTIALLLVSFIYSCTEDVAAANEEIEFIDSTFLWNDSLPCDYLVIAHDYLLNPALKLAMYRDSNITDDVQNPLVVSTSKIDSIYDSYTRQHQFVETIRSFLSDLKIKPKYVVLFSDTHIKPRLDVGIPIPDSYDTSNYFAYDHYYTIINDTSFFEIDSIDFVIGRVPVSTAEEGDKYVCKLKAFEANKPTSMTTILDDYWNNNNPEVLDFDKFFLEIDSTLEQSEHFNLQKSKFALQSYSTDNLNPLTDDQIQKANKDLIDTLNKCNKIITYLGHGNHNALTHESILTTHDLKQLTKISVWISLGCYTNAFTYEDSFAKELLRMPEGGAVAMIAPYPIAFGISGNKFIKDVYHSIYNESKSLGDAFYSSSRINYNFRFILLGDPAIRF